MHRFPIPRLVTTATALLIGLAASLAPSAAAFAEPPKSRVTDVRDDDCVTDDPRDLCADPGALLDVRIGDVHPTQPSLGHDEVFYKLGRYSAHLSKDEINKKFDDWCEANGQEEAESADDDSTLFDPSSFTCTVPVGSETDETVAAMKTVVVGPGGTLYLTDGHHTLTSFAEDSGEDVHVRLRVVDNLSGLGEAEFWDVMRENKWVWLTDVDGNAILPSDLPENVGLGNFQDDRYRSVMYFARDIGFTADGSIPFQEFYWGGWLKSRTDLDVAGWDPDDWEESLDLVRRVTEAQVALDPDEVIDPASGYTASDLGVLAEWNDGKKEDKGEWSKISKPYSDEKPGKLAYLTAYRAELGEPTPDVPGRVGEETGELARTGVEGGVLLSTVVTGAALTIAGAVVLGYVQRRRA